MSSVDMDFLSGYLVFTQFKFYVLCLYSHIVTWSFRSNLWSTEPHKYTYIGVKSYLVATSPVKDKVYNWSNGGTPTGGHGR